MNTMAAMQQIMSEIHNVGPRTREQIVSPTLCPMLSRYAIRLAGVSEARHGFAFTRLNPGMMQVLLCTGGYGEVWVDGDWRHCGKGDVYLTGSKIKHAYRAVRGSVWRLAWVSYNTTCSQDHPAGSLALTNPRLCPAVSLNLTDALTGLYRETMSTADPLTLQQWADLTDAMARRLIQPSAQQHNLWRIWEEVDANLAHPWALDELADLARISGETLRRLCHQHYHLSPMRYVLRLRMQRAAALLISTDRTCGAIATTVGYADGFAFSKAFTRYFGQSPSIYRTQASKQQNMGDGKK